MSNDTGGNMTDDYPPMPEGPVTVKRDGAVVAELDNADRAFEWLIDHQGQSVYYALRWGGYTIEAR